MTRLIQMLRAAEVNVSRKAFSSMNGIDDLVQPFVSFTFSPHCKNQLDKNMMVVLPLF